MRRLVYVRMSTPPGYLPDAVKVGELFVTTTGSLCRVTEIMIARNDAPSEATHEIKFEPVKNESGKTKPDEIIAYYADKKIKVHKMRPNAF